VALAFRLSSAQLTDSSYVVTLSGEIDAHSSSDLRRGLEALADDGGREMIVDLGQVPFLDSTILGVLLQAARKLRADGGEVVVVSDDPRVLRTFEISGLSSQFRFEPTLAAAVDRVLDTDLERQ
jgi:anti-anti-sigma factor